MHFFDRKPEGRIFTFYFSSSDSEVTLRACYGVGGERFFNLYSTCAEILLVFCICFDFLCLSAAKANAKLLEELSAKKDLSEPEKLAKEALERLANSPGTEEALLQTNLIRMKMKQECRTA